MTAAGPSARGSRVHLPVSRGGRGVSAFFLVIDQPPLASRASRGSVRSQDCRGLFVNRRHPSTGGAIPPPARLAASPKKHPKKGARKRCGIPLLVSSFRKCEPHHVRHQKARALHFSPPMPHLPLSGHLAPKLWRCRSRWRGDAGSGSLGDPEESDMNGVPAGQDDPRRQRIHSLHRQKSGVWDMRCCNQGSRLGYEIGFTRFR